MSLCDHCILFNLHDKELFFLKQAAESLPRADRRLGRFRYYYAYFSYNNA